MALTDVAIRNAKPKDKPYKLSDGFGLHIIIKPSGSKLWYQKYRFDGKEKRLAYGTYPKRNSVRAAYIHKAQFIDERKSMMQWWADYLDANKLGVCCVL